MALSPEEIDKLVGPPEQLSLTATTPAPSGPSADEIIARPDLLQQQPAAPQKPLSPQDWDQVNPHWTAAPLPQEPPVPVTDDPAVQNEYQQAKARRTLQLKGAGFGVVGPTPGPVEILNTIGKPLDVAAKYLGTRLDQSGQLIAGTGADVVAEAARPFQATETRADHFENIRALWNGDPLPVQEELKYMKGFGHYAASFAVNGAEQLPRMGLAAALGPEGYGLMSTPAAAATAFGVTQNGFDPVQGLVVAAIGKVSAAGGDYAADFLKTAPGQSLIKLWLWEKPVRSSITRSPSQMALSRWHSRVSIAEWRG